MSAEQVAFAQYLAKIRPALTYMLRADVADARWKSGTHDYRSRNYADSLRRASDLYRRAAAKLKGVKAPRALRRPQFWTYYGTFMYSDLSTQFDMTIEDLRVGVAEGDSITPTDWKMRYKEFQNMVPDFSKWTKGYRYAWLDDIATEAKRLGVPLPEKWFSAAQEKVYKAERETLPAD